ncbi:MAG TPA: hypothetical protein DCO79_15720 [Spirochaeta sp.]|nr:hypothetical protein [Spirochaeta sp.]
MTKFTKVIIISLAAILIFSFTSCDPNGDDGGQGADFDEAQYYTKTDVENLIADAVTEAKSYADGLGSTLVPLEIDEALTKSVHGFYDSANNLNWDVPTGATIGVFRVEKTAEFDLFDTIFFGPAEEPAIINYTLPTISQAFTAVVPTEGNGSIFGWTNDDTDAAQVEVTCLYWIK